MKTKISSNNTIIVKDSRSARKSELNNTVILKLPFTTAMSGLLRRNDTVELTLDETTMILAFDGDIGSFVFFSDSFHKDLYFDIISIIIFYNINISLARTCWLYYSLKALTSRIILGVIYG